MCVASYDSEAMELTLAKITAGAAASGSPPQRSHELRHARACLAIATAQPRHGPGASSIEDPLADLTLRGCRGFSRRCAAHGDRGRAGRFTAHGAHQSTSAGAAHADQGEVAAATTADRARASAVVAVGHQTAPLPPSRLPTGSNNCACG